MSCTCTCHNAAFESASSRSAAARNDATRLRPIARFICIALLLVASVASADPPPGVVDPGDLPPLPTEGEAVSSTATVLAATSAEEDVVVGAAKREQSLGSVASAVTVVSADRIKRFGYRTVGEAIAGVAGVYLVDNRLSYSVGIRGLNILGDYNTRILVLVDGATINEAWAAFAGLGFDSFISIDEIARIEVIRGPVSSVYGANAFFGIINIVTRGAADSPKAWARTSVNSINGSVTSAGFSAGDVRKQIRGSVQFMDRFGETLTLPDAFPGEQLHGDGSQQYAASLVGSYNGTFGQIRAYHFYRDSPFAPYDGDPTANPPYVADDTQLLAEGGHTHEITPRLTVSARAYANLYWYSDHIIQEDMPPFDDRGYGAAYGLELRGRYEIVAPQKLGITVGNESTYYSTSSKSFTEGMAGCDEGAACVPKNFGIEGIYTEVDGQPTKWLGFTGGVRFDDNSVLDKNVSPRAALFISQPEKYGLKLLYAEGFRNPSAYEAFFFDNVSFAQPVNIHAEKIQSLEAVLWAKPIGGMSLRLSGFYWDATGIVEQLPDPDDMTLLQFQNAGQYISEGIEAEGSYRTSGGWYAFGGGTYAHVGEGDQGSPVVFGNVVNAPALTASGGISTPKLFGVGHLSAELDYIGARETRSLGTDADGNDVPGPTSPAWFGLDATLYIPNIPLRLGNHVSYFDFTAGVRNLIGTRDLVPAPQDYDRIDPNAMTTTVVPQVPGEGRELFAKVGYAY
ncbi:MAG TPA: TonB-dependent receptor [Kofleriaceae bacterium]|jgi:iron complex outermembrane receptor protein